MSKKSSEFKYNGKTIKMSPDEYFQSFADLYSKAGALDTSGEELTAERKSQALEKLLSYYKTIAKIMVDYKSLLIDDVHRMNAVGNTFQLLDEDVANQLNNE